MIKQVRKTMLRNRSKHHFCVECGRPFQSHRFDAIYCGPTCRQRANRAKRKAG
jgi:hypothetical protein